jgi:hypothetical protein
MHFFIRTLVRATVMSAFLSLSVLAQDLPSVPPPQKNMAYLDQIQLSCMKLFSQSTSILGEIDDASGSQIDAIELYTHEYPPQLARLSNLFYKSYLIITELRSRYSDEKMSELIQTQHEMENIVDTLKKTNRKIQKMVTLEEGEE